MVSKPNKLTVVLAEDDDGHALLVARHFARAGHQSQIVRLRDGCEVLDYFLRPSAHDGGALLLLDVDLPRLSGLDVLRRLKQNAATRALPIVMLTTTDDPSDVARCYELGCNVYVTKPVGSHEFAEVIARLAMFLQVVEVPPYAASRR